MSYSVKLPIGSLGLCYAAIEAGKWGEAYIHYVPEGPWTEVGKFPPGHYKVHALEDIREFRDIIIIDANNGAIEHTPQEIKYMNRQMKWQNVNLDYPLPVTMGTKAITFTQIVATAAGDTLVITPSVANHRIRVHYFEMSNRHTTVALVGMRFQMLGLATGTIMHETALAANGGTMNANLTDTNWEGADGETLYVWLNAAYANGIYFTIGYTEEDMNE